MSHISSPPRVRTLVVLLCGLLAGSSARADVLVVDPAGGGDFVVLQEAVDAAADGDVLLLAPGVHTGALLAGKSLHLVGDGVGVVLAGHVRVIGLAAGQRVTLADLEIEPPWPAVFDPFSLESLAPALAVVECAGAVRVERCTLRAPSLEPGEGQCLGGFVGWPPAPDGAVVRSSHDVVLSGCLLEGGYGVDAADDLMCLEHGSDGGAGLRVRSARVDLHAVIARGGHGAFSGTGGLGGHGVVVEGHSDLLASGVIAEGGDGGKSLDFIGFDGSSDGGDGLRLGPDAVARFVGGVYGGGAAGETCCWVNQRGEAQVLEGAAVTYPGGPHRLLTDSPAREGELLELTLTGSAGDTAFLFAGFGSLALHKPGLGGAIYVAPPFAFGPSAVAPLGDGITAYPLPVPELGPGLDALLLDLQMFVVEGGGAQHLTAPAVAVLLDAGL